VALALRQGPIELPDQLPRRLRAPSLRDEFFELVLLDRREPNQNSDAMPFHLSPLRNENAKRSSSSSLVSGSDNAMRRTSSWEATSLRLLVPPDRHATGR
jgi:hypothetical protein